MFTENDFKGAFTLAGCAILTVIGLAGLVGCGLGLVAAKLLGL